MKRWKALLVSHYSKSVLPWMGPYDRLSFVTLVLQPMIDNVLI